MRHMLLSVIALLFSTKQTNCQILNGGDEEIRTPDPLLARQVLSQLSYAPIMG